MPHPVGEASSGVASRGPEELQAATARLKKSLELKHLSSVPLGIGRAANNRSKLPRALLGEVRDNNRLRPRAIGWRR